MALKLGDTFPNTEVETNQGRFKLHDFFGDSWGILFSHPRDFTPVCTTELGAVAKFAPEFERRGVKVIALSCDGLESHAAWIQDIQAHTGHTVSFPIIADEKRELATELAMLDPEEKDEAGMPVTVRAVFILNPAKKVALTITYPPAVGRNFAEVLRVVDALQRGAKHPVATPVDWKAGEEVMVQPSLSAAQATALFPGHRQVEVPSGKGYLRYAADPESAAATASAAAAAE